MPAKSVVLGFDTSCYTTSVAVMDLTGQLLEDRRQVLKVKQGGCGLAQSEMVFQHTRNMPELLELVEGFGAYDVRAIGVTARPRPLAESYMPAFLVGLGTARNLASVLQVPLYQFSHQENHLEAGLWSAQRPKAERFLLLHASGGTTDILLVQAQGQQYQLTPCGGSIDLHAGQFIDRVGVALGLGFPTGPALEKLAQQAAEPELYPVAVKAGQISFAGPCTAVLRSLDKQPAAAVALGTEYAIGKSLARCLVTLCQSEKVQAVLAVGGVAANQCIRALITKQLEAHGAKLYLPDARYSSDNAVGSAAYALRQWECQHG